MPALEQFPQYCGPLLARTVIWRGGRITENGGRGSAYQIPSNPHPAFRDVVEHDLEWRRFGSACKLMTLSRSFMANFNIQARFL